MSNHPNSLKNLKPAWTTESAREAQANSVIARKANAEARAALKLTAKQFEEYKHDVLSETEVSSIDVLKILMLKALEANDFDTAADLAKTLAEFEAPKLARTEATVTEIDASDMSDEELEAKLQELSGR